MRRTDPGIMKRLCACMVCACFFIESSALPVFADVIPTISITPPALITVRAEDPCSASSGGFFTPTENAVGHGHGSPAIDLELAHNSLRGVDSIWGAGWHSALDQKLVQNSNNSVTWTRGGGDRRTYYINSAQGAPRTYALPVNTYTTLMVAAEDAEGNPTQLEQREKDGTTVRYDLAGSTYTFLPALLTDRNGNTLTYARDGDGRMTQITDIHGRFLAFTYNPATGKVLTVTDSGERTTTFGYNEAGQKISEQGPKGTKGYAYDAANRITRITYPNGGRKDYTYDGQGRVLTESDDGGVNRRTYVYEPTRTVVTDSLGRTTIYEHGGRSRVSRIIAPGNRITEFEYDANLNLTLQRDPAGREARFVYDENGNVTKTFDPEGEETTLAYEPAFNQVASVTDPKRNPPTTMTYDGNGNLTRVTDAAGKYTEMGYVDGQGHVTSVQNPVNRGQYPPTTFSYDPANGALTTVIDPLIRRTEMTRDALSRVTNNLDAAQKNTGFSYDDAGNLLSVTDHNLKVTNYSYVPGRNGRLLESVTDARGNPTNFGYDVLGRLTSVTNALGQTKRFSYDDEGNLKTVHDAKGQAISFAYDELNRLVMKSLPEGNVSYTYDDAGNLTLVTHYNGSAVAMTYDALDRVERVVQTFPDGFSATIDYGYDANGNRTSMSSSLFSGSFAYVYDPRNRLTSITNPDGRVISFSYDDLGRRTQMVYPNGIETNYSYDAASQLTRIEHKRVSDSEIIAFNDYAYDEVGNRTSMTDLAGAHAFGYDGLHRLISAEHPPGSNVSTKSEVFDYDRAGNRTEDARMTGYQYDAANRMLSNSSFTYAYDGNGNQTGKTGKQGQGATGYAYNSGNRLIQADMPGGTRQTNVYDALGRRIEKSTGPVGNLTTVRYVYDNEDILAMLDTNNQLIALFTHGPGIDEPLIMKDASGEEYFLHADALGSVVAVTDGQRNVVERVEYEAYGMPRFVDLRGGTPVVGDQSLTANPHAFTGRVWDAGRRQYDYRERQLYDPETGRFGQEDPVGSGGSANLYAYVDTVGKPSVNFAPYFDGVEFGSTNLYHYAYNNPVNNTDPNGTFVFLGGAVLTGTILATGYAIYFAYGVARNIQTERDAHGNLTTVYWEAPIYWKSTPFPWLTGMKIDMTVSERKLRGEKFSYPHRFGLIYPPPSTQYCVGSGT